MNALLDGNEEANRIFNGENAGHYGSDPFPCIPSVEGIGIDTELAKVLAEGKFAVKEAKLL